MVTFSLLLLAAASLSSSVFAAPNSKSPRLNSAKEGLAKRICPIACPPDTILEPPCNCKPTPALKERARLPICEVFCEFGKAPGAGCQCNAGPGLEKRNCDIYCPYGYDPTIPCKCLPNPGIDKRNCDTYCPFGYDPSVPCKCLLDPSIRCGNICLPGNKHDPHAAGLCNCAPYHPCNLEARCVTGELFAWNNAAQKCHCLKRKNTCTEDITCLTGFGWQYESASRVCKCLPL